MPDPDSVNLPLTGSGDSTTRVATDQITGSDAVVRQFQYVKLAVGTLDDGTPVGVNLGTHGTLLVADERVRRLLEEFLPDLSRLLLEVAEPDTARPPARLLTNHVNVTNTATQIVPPNANRRRILVINYQTVTVYIGMDLNVSTSNGIRLDSGASLTLAVVGPLFGITTSTYTAASEDTKVHIAEESD